MPFSCQLLLHSHISVDGQAVFCRTQPSPVGIVIVEGLCVPGSGCPAGAVEESTGQDSQRLRGKRSARGRYARRQQVPMRC